MKRLAWATDIHLNFAGPETVAAFGRAVAASGADALVISGDIAEAAYWEEHLTDLELRVGLPIHFVLGNHDFSGSSIAHVRQRAEALSARRPELSWLPAAGVVPLTERTCLIGHDGWADGRCGDYAGSTVMLNDYRLIRELASLGGDERLRRLHQLGDEAAAHCRRLLPEALDRFEHIVAVTHVPPFREACWHQGAISDDNWLPHFTCRAVGEVLAEFMRARPDRDMLVLCGHTHGEGQARILPNLLVRTGGAEYGKPALQSMIELV